MRNPTNRSSRKGEQRRGKGIIKDTNEKISQTSGHEVPTGKGPLRARHSEFQNPGDKESKREKSGSHIDIKNQNPANCAKTTLEVKRQ